MSDVAFYFPAFLCKFWLSATRLHVYDVYNNELQELCHEPKDQPSVFQDFNIGCLGLGTQRLLHYAEQSFARLEHVARFTLADILDRTLPSDKGRTTLSLSRVSMEELRKYFVFLRFRNSPGYQLIIRSLQEDSDHHGNDSTLFHSLVVQNRLRCILHELIRFLHHKSDGSYQERERATTVPSTLPFLKTIEDYCWRFLQAELSFGLASDEQEFILPERCFGTLDEGIEKDPGCDLFFPITPTLALYMIGQVDESFPNSSVPPSSSRIIWLDVDIEPAIDVHLRNALILQTYPKLLYFRSLRSVALSISSYEEFRSTLEHIDYSRLKQRCRQKFLRETVTKTLVIRGSVIVTDLTDEVVIMGDSAVAYGSFSDVWKGRWEDPIDRRQKVVALKFLRQVVVKGLREKLLKRLQAEVLAWHRLCHKNVSQLFGIIQSAHSIAMVSQWCENGTVSHYLKNSPDASRLKLLVQVASGIAYLHHMNIIHGDLKGGNILVDEHENAIITDFGLSRIVEEVTSDTINAATSFFAGSTRWMAPELIFALVEDDGGVPPITTSSDVYAFSSVCLELASGHPPYPHRSNDHAVTVDILRGIGPTRSSGRCLLKLDENGEQAFWNMLEQSWSVDPLTRPSMLTCLYFWKYSGPPLSWILDDELTLPCSFFFSFLGCTLVVLTTS